MMDKEKISIRYATPFDNRLLAELGARTFQEAFARDNTPEDMGGYLAASFSPEIQAAELANPQSVFLIMELDGLPVGYSRLREAGSPACVIGTHPIEIVRFYIAQPRIGQGFGGWLMQACLEEAGKRGCGTIWLDVWEHNPRAISFYRKWGFVEVGTQAFQLGADRQTDLIMQRPVHLPQQAES
jgi:ribosomal protein S18 acetylase RimI-like enzyme